jgi:cyanophycin synthetase
VVISGPGDRRDQDIRQQTEILGNVFDEIVMFEDQCQRGRQDGEVITLLKEGLQKAQRAQERHEIYGEFAAIDLAMDKLQAGELCLILVDQVEEAMAHIAAKATGN